MICMGSITKTAKKILEILVGTAQTTLGASAVVLAYFLYINFFGLQTWLNVSKEFLPLQILIIIVFGFFSIMNGLFLLTERVKSP